MKGIEWPKKSFRPNKLWAGLKRHKSISFLFKHESRLQFKTFKGIEKLFQ